MTWRGRYPVRFAHCDPAGIAYFPRLFELVDTAVEDWTAHALPVSRAAMHVEHGLGMPTVDLRAHFAKPCRLGETLELTVAAARVGRSSVELAVGATCGGEERFAVRATQVLIALATARATPWPDTWRAGAAG